MRASLGHEPSLPVQSDYHTVRKSLSAEALLLAITRAQESFIRGGESSELFGGLLDDILEITESEYGFIGEVLDDGQAPYLKTHAITNIAWNEETKRFYDDNIEGGFKLGYANDRYELAVFGRNITDEENLKGGIDFNNLTGFVNEPRIFGVSFATSF